MIAPRLPRIVGWAGVVYALGSGASAFAAFRSFYDNIATFQPYNRHFLHDIGAFTIGLGAVMLFALVPPVGPAPDRVGRLGRLTGARVLPRRLLPRRRLTPTSEHATPTCPPGSSSPCCS
jgi:hypothetical protein